MKRRTRKKIRARYNRELRLGLKRSMGRHDYWAQNRLNAEILKMEGVRQYVTHFGQPDMFAPLPD